MRMVKGVIDEFGRTRKDLPKCEHCGNYMVMQEKVKPEDVVCGKCRMTSDKE